MFCYSHFFSKKYQNICLSLDVNFNKSLTNDIVSFEQLGPDLYNINAHSKFGGKPLIFTSYRLNGNPEVLQADNFVKKKMKFAH